MLRNFTENCKYFYLHLDLKIMLEIKQIIDVNSINFTGNKNKTCTFPIKSMIFIICFLY